MPLFRSNIGLIIGLTVLLSGCQSHGVDVTENPANQTSSRFTAADEALYQKRFENLMEAFKTTGRPAPYDNLEPVAGTDQYTPLPKSLAAATPASILKARAYAGSNNSLAFMIWHKGKIIEDSEQELTLITYQLDTLTIGYRSIKKCTIIKILALKKLHI